jgi:NDMA-dependent alcohol dehydrogenase
MMKSRAAVCRGIGQDWVVEDIDLDPPKAGEVLVKVKAAGMCHSDDHILTGDASISNEAAAEMGMPGMFPVIGGHEGAGVVLEVGAGVIGLEPGDHVSCSFIPSCGTCRYCSSGRQNLCDLGAQLFQPGMMTDGTCRAHSRGEDLNAVCKLGTFAEHMVVTPSSLVKVERHLPFGPVAIVSCAVATGWGSAVKRADVRPGDVVVVVGIGGIGINAVQGARMAGARHVVAVDPVQFKRDTAKTLGATHTFSSMSEAIPVVTELTRGQMADKVIMAPGVLRGEMMLEAMTLTGKGGTCVATAVAPMMANDVTLNLFELTIWQKELKGALFGALNPRDDIPKLLSLYCDGSLKLDELITRTYTLDQINEGYQDMRDGKNIRGVIMLD